MDRVKGKVAIVTGGATGIGRSIAEMLKAEGADVVITDVNDNQGERTAQEMGGSTVFIPHDVACEEDWKAIVEQTVRNFGSLDILVNNAGVIFTAPEPKFGSGYSSEIIGIVLSHKGKWTCLPIMEAYRRSFGCTATAPSPNIVSGLVVAIEIKSLSSSNMI